MKLVSKRRLALLFSLFAVVGLLAMACGSDEEEGAGPTNPPAASGTGAAASPTAGGLKLGAAGLPSKPRTVSGLDAWTGLTNSFDDGLAIWKTRPASENRTGITKDNIKLGQSAIITGAAASSEACWGPLHQEILKRINDAGGIHGRKIEFIKYDDALNPALTVQNIKRLVEQDKIFATYFSENTVGHQATRDYLMENEILELFPTDNDLGSLELPWPYYTGVVYVAPFIGSAVYADYIKENMPGAKVGVITSDSAYAQNDRTVFKAQAEKLGLNIVADVLVPQGQTDPTSQVQQMVGAGADVIVNNLLPAPAANALIALRQTLGNKTIKTMKFSTPRTTDVSPLYDGDLNAVTYKQPESYPELPIWNQLKQVANDAKATWCGSSSTQIVNATEFMVRVLEAAGPDPTREGVLEALQYAFDGYDCTLCITPVYISYVDTMAWETFQFTKWDSSQNKAVSVGEPVSYETSLGKGVRGNDPKYPCALPQQLKELKLPNFPNTLCPWKNP